MAAYLKMFQRICQMTLILGMIDFIILLINNNELNIFGMDNLLNL